MAEPEAGSSLMDTFKQKVGPLPLGVWIAALAVIGGFLWYRHKQAASATQAAADQTNSNLGSASQLANSFGVAGTMPYSGGDTYINSVGTGNIGGPPAPQTTNIAYGMDLYDIIKQIRVKYNPSFSFADFWQLNPQASKFLKYDPKTKKYTFTKNATITISTPNMVELPQGK